MSTSAAVLSASTRSVAATASRWDARDPVPGYGAPRTASLLFAFCGILVIFAVLIFCHRRRWILEL